MFGTNASLAYGLQIQRHDNYWQNKIIYSMYREVRSPYTEHAANGLPNPTPLKGEVRFIQATDQQMLQYVVREW